jgi:hypothetical protein
MSEGNLDHEQELNRLLDELGQTLGRRERVLEGMKRTRTQARLHEITVEADQAFEGWDQDMLVEDLQRELDHQRAHELELQRVLVPEHRDDLGELWRRMERRDAIFEDITAGSLEQKRELIPEAMNCQRGLEEGLFKLIERHLTRMRRS